MNTFYQFTITYYDDSDDKTITHHGILCASTYQDAVAQLSEFYGDGMINYCSIRYLCENFVRTTNLPNLEQVTFDELNQM